MRYCIINVLILLATTISYAQKDSTSLLKVSEIQKEVLAQLTGVKDIKNEIFLQQRATPEERRLAAEYLSSLLTNYGWTLNNHHYKVSNGNPLLDLLLQPMEGINVCATLESTNDSDKYVIFGSHYDSERDSPGAIDNASGVVLSLGVAHQLAKVDKRGINYMIVFFDQEEDNEVGSKAFAQMLKKSDKDIHSVHTIDMMGWDSDGNRGIEIELPTENLRKLYYDVAEQHRIPIETTRVSSTDHQSFRALGFNAVGITEEYVKRDTTPHIHKSTDTYDTVDFEFLLSSTQLIFNVLYKISLSYDYAQ